MAERNGDGTSYKEDKTPFQGKKGPKRTEGPKGSVPQGLKSIGGNLPLYRGDPLRQCKTESQISKNSDLNIRGGGQKGTRISTPRGKLEAHGKGEHAQREKDSKLQLSPKDCG